MWLKKPKPREITNLFGLDGKFQWETWGKSCEISTKNNGQLDVVNTTHSRDIHIVHLAMLSVYFSLGCSTYVVALQYCYKSTTTASPVAVFSCLWDRNKWTREFNALHLFLSLALCCQLYIPTYLYICMYKKQ